MNCATTGKLLSSFACCLSLWMWMLIPVPSVQASSSTCPDLSRNSRAQTSSPQETTTPYATDRIIVKFKDSLTESADLLHGAGGSFAQAAPTGGSELDELNRTFGVERITPVFEAFAAGEDRGRGKSRWERKGC